MLASASIIINAVVIVLFAARRAVEFDQYFVGEPEENVVTPAITFLIPFASSFGLLLLAYFDWMAQAVLLSSLASTSMGLYIVISYFWEYFGYKRSISPLFTAPNVITAVLILILEATWIITGNVTLNNVVASAVSVLAVIIVRLNSLKSVTILLIGLFLYDIFWVFLSPYLFQNNIMTQAALKAPDNPVAGAAEALNIPQHWIAIKLSPPAKIVWGEMMLGLGDIVIPGAVVAYCLRVDHISEDGKNRYFLSSILAYQFGLISAIAAAFTFRSAQPALLYIVPCLLGSIVCRHTRDQSCQVCGTITSR